MNEQLPYERDLANRWDDLALPDENMAWADMKQRLEEDDDTTPVAWWRRGCALWGILLIAAIAWWILKPVQWFKHARNENAITTENKNNNQTTIPINPNHTEVDTSTATNSIHGQHPSVPDSLPATISITPATSGIANKPGEQNNINAHQQSIVNTTKGSTGKRRSSNKRGTAIDKNTSNNPVDKNQPVNNEQPVVKTNPANNEITTTISPVSNDSGSVKKTTDSLKKKLPSSDISTVRKDPKTDSTIKRPLYLSGGIAIQQQLPIGGQSLTPYNASGRKGSLGDYIPSVYLRLNKKDKWFLQGEFRYGAPQHTKQLTYQQTSVPDTGQNPVYTTKTSSTLKKTFYHQLPLTFNYLIRSNWSVGAGIQWNKFFAAISENEVVKTNNITQQDSLFSKQIVARKNDTSSNSVFKNAYFLGVIETQYRWKKFSFGAKYTFGLQPYIRFQLPGGSQQEERSKSIQVFIRYQLFGKD